MAQVTWKSGDPRSLNVCHKVRCLLSGRTHKVISFCSENKWLSTFLCLPASLFCLFNVLSLSALCFGPDRQFSSEYSGSVQIEQFPEVISHTSRHPEFTGLSSSTPSRPSLDLTQLACSLHPHTTCKSIPCILIWVGLNNSRFARLMWGEENGSLPEK